MRDGLIGWQRVCVGTCALVFFGLLCHAPATGQQPVSTATVATELTTGSVSEGGPEYQINCGVNSTYLALRLAGAASTIKEVAHALRAGERFERDCSFADIRRVLGEVGITAKGFKANDVSAILASLHDRNIVIMRIQNQEVGATRAHFGVLVGTPERAILIDPPHANRAILADAAISDPWFTKSTGEFLVISPLVSTLLTGAALEVLDAELELGDIPAGLSKIEGVIRVRNMGDTMAVVSKVDGPCACYLGASGDMKVRPGATGQIRVKFDKNRLPVGRLERHVTLKTNNTREPEIRVTIRLNIKATLDRTETRVTPQIISFGRTTAKEITSQPITIRVSLPHDSGDAPSKVTPTSDCPGLVITPLDDMRLKESDDSSTRVVSYRLTWKKLLPQEPFHHKIHISIERSGGIAETLVIPVNGDVID